MVAPLWIADYSRAIELNPAEPDSWLKRTRVYFQLGQGRKALGRPSSAGSSSG